MSKSELMTLLESVASIAKQTSEGIKTIKTETDFDAYYYAWVASTLSRVPNVSKKYKKRLMRSALKSTTR